MAYYYQHITLFDNGNVCCGEVTNIDLAVEMWNEDFYVSNTSWESKPTEEKQIIIEETLNYAAELARTAAEKATASAAYHQACKMRYHTKQPSLETEKFTKTANPK
jgi:hypothetical protein